MKASIHPQYYSDTIVTCSCGNSFTTGSVRKSIVVEVCSKCHPFYSGEEKLLDTKGRADDFARKQKIAATYKTSAKSKKQKKSSGQDENRPKTLRELLSEV